MPSLDDLQDQQPSDSGLRPETTDYLNNLAGIGTQAYLAMRDPDLPEYEDWCDSNFAPDDSGNYLSREGQSYSDDELQHMHGFLSRQAGNPFVSSLFDGPDSPIADYMVWRNQNFSNDNGPWEDEDGNLYSEQALQGMFADKFGAEPEDSPEESGQNTQHSAPAAGQSATQAGPGQQQLPPLGNRMSDLAESLKQTADYMKWRDQNYRQMDDGRWAGPDARIYTNEELKAQYDSRNKSQTSRTPSQDEIVAYIRQQADAYGIPQALALGLVNKESHFNQSLTGPVGEVGLCQILKERDGETHQDANGNDFALDIKKATSDWQYNVRAGLSLLKKAYDFAQKNAPNDAIAATYGRYNAQGNWKGYRALNSNVHDHVYGKWIVRNGHRIYVDGYMDFYHKWGGK